MSAHEVIYEFAHDPDGYKAFLRDLMEGQAKEPWETHRLAQRHGGIPVLVSAPHKPGSGLRVAAPLSGPTVERRRPVRWRLWAVTVAWFLLWGTVGWQIGRWIARVVG